jgi:hypothetical protein
MVWDSKKNKLILKKVEKEIEIDENQHVAYDCSCENKRIMELSQDVGHRPIVFIRFNPDGYKDHKGTYKNTNIKSRLPILLQEIETHIKRIEKEENKDYLEIHKLYYDGYK